MIQNLWLIGIGTGSEAHITQEGMQAIRDAAVILIPEKPGKDELADLRYRLIRNVGSKARIIPFEYPIRDQSLPYHERIDIWHDQIAERWQQAANKTQHTGPVALLVWGDPSLYDSTIRIAGRLTPKPQVRVVPGITAIQALTAAHAIPLNTINGPVQITTGRRLRDEGWPAGADSVVVMLDAKLSFQQLDMPDLYIWWGAYLGSPQQILMHGQIKDVTDEIQKLRTKARAQHGWIMDTYLLRK